jgi:hypothetical protein
VTTGARQQHQGVGGISHRTASWLAWSLWAVCVVLIALALLLDIFTDDVPVQLDARPGFGLVVLAGVLSLAFPTVGALIASRLPANPIGWIFCCAGLVLAMQRFTIAYADYALLETLALPWGQSVAWFASWVWVAIPTLLVFLLLLFPSGRLVSRRWRIVVWVVLLGAALIALAEAFGWRVLWTHPWVYNPFWVWVTGGVTTYQYFVASSLFGNALLLTSTLAALLSLILRLHRARGDERQQLKWFLYPVVPAIVFLSVITVHWMVLNFTTEFLFSPVYLLSSLKAITAINYVSLVAALVIPVCTYIAIHKYRLYDIDIVINRALVYGSLTTMLALIYFGSVTATQAIFRALTGQQEQPQLAIVISTLVIAALFNPLRRRIQGFIDRRFYRRKYDAAKTLEVFSAKLRDETDLDAVSDDLVGVVRETMQPSHVSLWLRPDTATRSKAGESRD